MQSQKILAFILTKDKKEVVYINEKIQGSLNDTPGLNIDLLYSSNILNDLSTL